MGGAGLRLVARNLGPIGHADVALRPLTVLIGRNNTGKTYLAQALYAAYKAIDSYRPSVIEPLQSEELSDLHNVLLQHLDAKSSEESVLLSSVTRGLQQRFSSWISQALHESGSELERRLLAYFGVPDLSEITSWNRAERVTVQIHGGVGDACLFGSNSETRAELSEVLEIGLDKSRVDIEHYASLARHNGDDEHRKFITRELSWIIALEIWHNYCSKVGFARSAHYLPAGRSGLLLAWADVVKLRLQLERERYGLSRRYEPSLDGIALDFISSLADILGRRGHRSRYAQYSLFDPAETLERAESLQLLQTLVEGRVVIGFDEDMVPTLDYEQYGHKIALRRASSMVADLAPLAMWMGRVIGPGDLVIIDEPESHLHPGAVRLIARVLVRLVNEGVRVVCATHSSTLLHELSNSVLRSRLYDLDAESSAEGYLESDVLRVEDIAVHRFVRSEPGSPVETMEVTIDPKWGIPEDEYVEVAGDLSDDSARLIRMTT